MKKYILIIMISFLVYNYIQISRPLVASISLKEDKLKGEVRVTQISDFHNNKYLKEKVLLKKIGGFNPNIIALTGDIIDRETQDWTISLSFIERLYGICENIYFVSGNHEMTNKGYSSFLEDLRSIGVRVIDNEIEVFKLGEDYMNLIGVDYYFSQQEYKKMVGELDGSTFSLVLSHSPDKIVRALSGQEDLVLSGHTHGGQVRLPLIGGLVAPGQGFFPKLDKGTYNFGKTKLYIDSGLGNSQLPIRFLNRVQISNISLCK